MGFKITPILVIFALFFVAVFGFLGMGAMEHSGLHTCLFAAVGNGPCVALQNTIAVTAHYLEMAGWLLGALASADVFALIFSIPLFVILFAVFIFGFSIHILSTIPRSVVARPCALFSKEQDAVLQWLAFHNKRDPHAFTRALGRT